MLVGVIPAFPGEGSCHWFLLCVGWREFTKHRKENSVKTQTYPFSCFSLNLDLTKVKKKERKLVKFRDHFIRENPHCHFIFQVDNGCICGPCSSTGRVSAETSNPNFRASQSGWGLKGPLKIIWSNPLLTPCEPSCLKIRIKHKKTTKVKNYSELAVWNNGNPNLPSTERKYLQWSWEMTGLCEQRLKCETCSTASPRIHHAWELTAKIPKHSLAIHQGNPSKIWVLAQQWLKSPLTEIKL